MKSTPTRNTDPLNLSERLYASFTHTIHVLLLIIYGTKINYKAGL